MGTIQIQTVTGRRIPAPPRICADTARKSMNGIKKLDAYLKEEALAEAQSRSDDYNLVWIDQLRPGRFSVADRDLANDYLFGEIDPEWDAGLCVDGVARRVRIG
jgi:hypothetical protein